MTILAGVISRTPSASVPDALCAALRRTISRDPADRPIEFRTPHCFFIKVDIGAFGRPAHHQSPEGSFAMLAGEPLLVCDGPRGEERDAHLEYLQAAWDNGDFSPLRHASGTFCAAYFDPRHGTARLVADRLGLRTLYYAVTEQFVFFSSALRILEALDDLPKTMDVVALVEITGFGYPFGGGTPYAGIRMMLPCEMITVGPDGIRSSRYFRWDAIKLVQASGEEMREATHHLFQQAIRRRLRGDRTTFAYLSGGLDSRCTVAGLLAEGARVYTFNFSPPRTQDQVFALQYAEKSGAVHHETPAGANPNWSAIMADAWRASPRRAERMPERLNVVWTGEGGSVGLGHVYITPEIVKTLRAGDSAGAVDVFLQQQRKSLLSRILNDDVASSLRGHLQKRLLDELKEIDYPDPVRAFYIFLNLNGPRRHLVKHFETIDQHRLEFQVPFYDSEFLEYLTALPVDPCLYHRFYVQWLSSFDPAVREVPWQAYPGHTPSIVPVPDDLPDQWGGGSSSAYRSSPDDDLIERAKAMLSAPDFPFRVLHKGSLRLMLWATKLGLGNYGYALKAGLAYYECMKTCKGKYELPTTLGVTEAQVA
ncbi:asparagine synthase-related protein [Propionivibrio sp.]|uniref:asparagine synthase-related protein n=1 Tax=Propionivibrio sp. TaxID=2212460 RepID=UPI0039E481F9